MNTLTPRDITAVIPAHNEAATIAATIASLQAQGVWDILVMCDNCTDDTKAVARWVGAYAVDTECNSARKAGALNQGLERLSIHRPEAVLAMDADTILQPGWVDEALRVLNGQLEVGAVGAIFEADRADGWLRRCQALEWHRFARECDRTGRTFVLSGTAALICWEALEDVREVFAPKKLVSWCSCSAPYDMCWHGPDIADEPERYSPRAITEDFDFTVRLKRCGWELRSPDACRTTTETMPTVGDLFRQRRRWSLGALQTVKRHGLNKATRIYWFQQAMLLLSILAMALLISLTVASLATSTMVLSKFWVLVGLVFVVERVVTVWDRPWKDRVFAALMVPELLYALTLQASHLAALAQFATGSNGSWHHATKKD